MWHQALVPLVGTRLWTGLGSTWSLRFTMYPSLHEHAHGVEVVQVHLCSVPYSADLPAPAG